MTPTMLAFAAATFAALAVVAAISLTMAIRNSRDAAEFRGSVYGSLARLDKELRRQGVDHRSLQRHTFAFFSKHRQAALTVREYEKQDGAVQTAYQVIPQEALKAAVRSGLEELRRRRQLGAEAVEDADAAGPADAAREADDASEYCPCGGGCACEADDATVDVPEASEPRPVFKPRSEYYNPSRNGFYRPNPSGVDV